MNAEKAQAFQSQIHSKSNALDLFCQALIGQNSPNRPNQPFIKNIRSIPGKGRFRSLCAARSEANT